MSTLGRRLQVLLDEERMRRLELRSRATGASVGALVREAIDVAFPGPTTDRERAGNALLDAAPMPVSDWEDLKRDAESMLESA
jgi:hypothetical protein